MALTFILFFIKPNYVFTEMLKRNWEVCIFDKDNCWKQVYIVMLMYARFFYKGRHSQTRREFLDSVFNFPKGNI